MSEKKKLLELLSESGFLSYEKQTEHLLAHGVTVRERGKWDYEPEVEGVICNKCGNAQYWGTFQKFAINFCSNCGADMREAAIALAETPKVEY